MVPKQTKTLLLYEIVFYSSLKRTKQCSAKCVKPARKIGKWSILSSDGKIVKGGCFLTRNPQTVWAYAKQDKHFLA